MDYSRLRALALSGAEEEEAVTVDTRALIDKVLARYSGEWTTLREIIQNAADAQATTVTIKFETLPSTQVPIPSSTSESDMLKHVLTHHTIQRLVVQNNGETFKPTDWARLKRIAEGNPDETKIGAFGVGFYSVFADCEEPFISSGNEAMAFYWKGNALFTKKSRLPEDEATTDTTFILDYRNTTTPIPNILSVAQFLGTSLTFVALEKIQFQVDNWQLLALHKKPSPSVEVQIPQDLETRTLEGVMTIASVERMNTQIDATFMAALGWKRPVSASAEKTPEAITETPLIKSFFARFASVASHTAHKVKGKADDVATQVAISEDITAVSTSTIFLRVTTAQIKTNVLGAFFVELERATKKAPPKIAKLAILTSSYEGDVAMETTGIDRASKSADVFATVLPSKSPGGRVFIGFPTMQTTGAGLHISAPSVIPTVEREAIDLNARWVKSWNMEMLRAAGILIRLSFFDDMAQLQKRLLVSMAPAGKLTSSMISQHMPEALHIYNTYTFGNATPNTSVGVTVEHSFWTSYKSATVDIYSTRGVLPTSKVRLPSPDVAKFVNGLPMLPDELKDTAFMRKLIEFDLITPITTSDILQELGGKAMDREQMSCFIKWAGKNALGKKLDGQTVKSLLGVAIGMVGKQEGQGEVIALSGISHFLGPNKIPSNVPIPPDTLPPWITGHCNAAELQALGWSALEVYTWLHFLIVVHARASKENLLTSPKFAVQALTITSKTWEHQTQAARNDITTLLRNYTVMPTKMGMKKPEEAFFPSVRIFDDLPVIEGCHHMRDKFLTAIGVRKTLDLETIFARLLSPSSVEGKRPWSHVELILYLASVKDDIPPADMQKFKEAKMCPAEGGDPLKLYQVAELFEPQESLRALGLPILQWPRAAGTISMKSYELRFLCNLGLRQYPNVPELVNLMAGPDLDLRRQAMAYFISKYSINGYEWFRLADSTTAFLPLEGNEKKLSQPSSCFSDESAAILGFPVLRRDLQLNASRLGVVADPPIGECVQRLLDSPPQTTERAKTLFGYFSRRSHKLKDNHISQLKNAPFVPIANSSGKTTRWISPTSCYLGPQSLYSDIFDFVDFGRDCNSFLYVCGAKSDPTKLELAGRVCEEPARLLESLRVEKYLNLLRSLAESVSDLKEDRALWGRMKMAPFLLGWKSILGSDNEGEEEETQLKHYQLAKPDAIVIEDDFISFRIFQSRLLCAPEDEVLEQFYAHLGSRSLTSVVQHNLSFGSEVVRKEEQAAKLRKHVVERSKIFLHEFARDRNYLINHNAKWLEKNLNVTMVQSISLRRKIPGYPETKTETRSVASTAGPLSRSTLYVSTQGSIDMYQLSQALCTILLRKHSQQSYIFFEPFLTLDLYALRSRGYNVDRILRVKVEEARIAEEMRQTALQEEQQRIKESHRTWAREEERAKEFEKATSRSKLKPPEPDLDESDDGMSPPGTSHGRKSIGSLISNLTRRIRDGKPDRAEEFEPLVVPPHPLHTHPHPHPHPHPPQEHDANITNPAILQQTLHDAIRNTRPHGSKDLVSPPKISQVKEQSTYCDKSSAQNLEFVAEAARGIKVFADKSLIEGAPAFLSKNSGAVNSFATVLLEAASTYNIEPSSLHMFYDGTGSTIAFNSGGSIFANLRFFLELHAKKVASKDPQTSLAAQGEAMSWWWVTLAHELAHNLIPEHNSEHSYFTESFIQHYLGALVLKLMPKLPQFAAMSGAAANQAAGPSSSSSAPIPVGLLHPPTHLVRMLRRPNIWTGHGKVH